MIAFKKVSLLLLCLFIINFCYSQETPQETKDKITTEKNVLQNTQSITFLTIGISALATVIVALALYIRKLHNKNMDVVIKFTESTLKTANSTDKINDSVEVNTQVLRDLHGFLIQHLAK